MPDELSRVLSSIMASSWAMEDEQGLFKAVLSEIHHHFKPRSIQLLVQSDTENTYERIAGYPGESSASGVLSRPSPSRCVVATEGCSPILSQTNSHTQLLLPLKHKTAPAMLLELLWEDAAPPEWVSDAEVMTQFGRKLGGYLPWKHVMIKIAAAKRHLEAIFDHLPGAVSVINSDYTIERVNRAFSRFFSIPCSEAIGKKCYDVVHGRTLPHEECRMQEALETDEKMSIDADNGKQLRVTYLPMAMKDNEPKCLQIFQLQGDVEDNRRVEQSFDFLQLYNLLSQPLTVLSLMSGVMSNDSKETISAEYLHIIKKQVEALMAILREAHISVTSQSQAIIGISPGPP